MQKKCLVFIFLLIEFVSVCALCGNNQTDINRATKEELEKLVGIGPVKAEEIIKSRPFNSVDDLVNVYGIGEKTLDKIKIQGIACVDKNEKNETAEEAEEETPEKDIEEETKPENIPLIESEKTFEIIKLTGKNIKTENNTEKKGNRYAIYGFVFFCVLLSVLFVLKFKKGNMKNEFRE